MTKKDKKRRRGPEETERENKESFFSVAAFEAQKPGEASVLDSESVEHAKNDKTLFFWTACTLASLEFHLDGEKPT